MHVHRNRADRTWRCLFLPRYTESLNHGDQDIQALKMATCRESVDHCHISSLSPRTWETGASVINISSQDHVHRHKKTDTKIHWEKRVLPYSACVLVRYLSNLMSCSLALRRRYSKFLSPSPPQNNHSIVNKDQLISWVLSVVYYKGIHSQTFHSVM